MLLAEKQLLVDSFPTPEPLNCLKHVGRSGGRARDLRVQRVGTMWHNYCVYQCTAVFRHRRMAPMQWPDLMG